MTDDAQAQAQHIAAEGKDIRQRVRDLTVKLVQQRDVGLKKFDVLASHIMTGAAHAVEDTVPQDPDSVLRQVVDGLADGIGKAANAAELTLEEAQSRGQAFAQEDIKSMIDDLRALQDMFVNTVSRTATHLKGRAGEEASDLKTHAQRAAESIKPSIESALQAAQAQPGNLAKESAQASVTAARQAAGALAHALSGLLSGAGDLLDGREPTHKK